MNAPKLLLASLLIAAASCNSGAKVAAAKFAGPSALAAFHGYSSRHPGEPAPRPYLAVASLLRDELTVLDPLDNEVVLGATLAFPLSVPTRPRPFKLATARIEADDAAESGPDLLVVASQSPPSLQLVTTWTEELRAVDLGVEDDLAEAYPGAALLSLAAMRKPGGGGAWVFAGLTGGNLAVLEFERDASSPLPVGRQPIRRSALPMQRKVLATGAGAFDPLDLAPLPDASRLFVATADPLQAGSGAIVLGVGQIALSSNAADPWPMVGLPARAGTRLVIAGAVVQRTVASPVVFESAPRDMVFAILDESTCGVRSPIDCGLVTLYPDVGIAPDPAGELPYQAPIHFSGVPTALALARPPRGGDTGTPIGVTFAAPPASSPDLMVLTPSASVTSPIRFWQTALLAVGLADGRVVAVDPGRWGLVNAVQRYDKDRRLLVTSVISSVTAASTPQLGVWNDVTGDGTTLVTDSRTMHQDVRATAGYLADDTLSIAWQGPLPGLAVRSGILQFDGGAPVVALQLGGRAQADLTSPELGIHVGDLVRFVPLAPTATTVGPTCYPDGFVATITEIRAASPAFPGGALALSHAGAGSASPSDVACADGAILVAAGSPGPVESNTITVSASGLVASGAGLGYLGRPVLNQPFELRYRDEGTLSGEELAIARKLRRRLYPADAPCGAAIPGTETGSPPQPIVSECDDPVITPPGPDPLAPGPALLLRVGCAGGTACAAPGAGAVLTLNATSGTINLVWASSATRGLLTAVTWLDGRTIDGARSTALYASFATNEVINATPNTGVVFSIR